MMLVWRYGDLEGLIGLAKYCIRHGSICIDIGSFAFSPSARFMNVYIQRKKKEKKRYWCM